MPRSSEESSSSPQLRPQSLPILAPRDFYLPVLGSSSTSPPQDQPAEPVRRARLSHRSRAGCWTCRGRKVKCDEQRPRCGPCTRLKRDCNWDHRWTFNHATEGTQKKHTQISTTGNAVWDAKARSTPSGSESPIRASDLPPFRVLTNDEDRERLAGSSAPGTYAVVVTPESFEALPEYAHLSSPIERRSSVRSGHGRTSPLLSRRQPRADPNVVFVDKFEETQNTPTPPEAFGEPARRASLPAVLDQPSEYTSAIQRSATLPVNHSLTNAESHLIDHFRQRTIYRIIPHVFDTEQSYAPQMTLRNVFEAEAAHFMPLYHAICALSALDLYYSQLARFADAAHHYHRALRVSEEDLRSNGSLLRHFLLLLHDITITFNLKTDDSSLWALHLNTIQRIIAERSSVSSAEPYAYFIWLVCNLDMQASLLGHGDCSFFCTMIDAGQVPHISEQIPQQVHSSSVPTNIFPMLQLNEAIVKKTAKIAQMAHSMRAAFNTHTTTASMLLQQFQPHIGRAQEELSEAWTAFCQPYLEPVTAETSQGLDPKARAIFESALTLYHAIQIYLRTSMFPRQRLVTTYNNDSINADTEARADVILGVAAGQLAQGSTDQRSIIFPVFIAGFVTRSSDTKIRAMDILKAFEDDGIGHNTAITRKLLGAVCEEQSQRLMSDMPMEEVDWLEVSVERGLRIRNCGL